MPNSIEGAKKIMQDNNIPADFLDKAVNIVTPFSSIFGVKKENIISDVEALKGSQSNQRKNIGTQRTQTNKKNNFKSKYPKI